jgi:alcohol dehydrogenase class IV
MGIGDSAAAGLRVPADLTIGAGASEQIGDVVRRHGVARPLLVTDPFMREHGPVAELVARMEKSGAAVAVTSDVQADPTVANVEGALAALRDHEADGVVAVGGGSPIDTAKAAAVLATNDGSLPDYAGYDRIPRAGLPVIPVPTTAGTGSEVTRVTVITDTERDVKMMLRADALLPRAAVVDHLLTLSCPPALTSHVGVDSLTHAIEAYVSTQASPLTDMFALEAARQIGPNLRRAFADGSDTDARAAMMLGATLAGIAFSNASVCLVHGMSRPIGAHFHVPHGLSNAVLLPTVTRYSVGAAPARYADMARAMGAAAPDASDDDACRALVDELEALNSDLSIPRLGELDIDSALFESRLDAMADAAIASGSPAFNPREPSRDEIVELYRNAY